MKKSKDPLMKAEKLAEEFKNKYEREITMAPFTSVGVAYLEGYAAAREDAERMLVAELQAINVQAIVNSQEGQLEVTERINAALARWKESGE